MYTQIIIKKFLTFFFVSVYNNESEDAEKYCIKAKF